jgi:hypothetical protein
MKISTRLFCGFPFLPGKFSAIGLYSPKPRTLIRFGSMLLLSITSFTDIAR